MRNTMIRASYRGESPSRDRIIGRTTHQTNNNQIKYGAKEIIFLIFIPPLCVGIMTLSTAPPPDGGAETVRQGCFCVWAKKLVSICSACQRGQIGTIAVRGWLRTALRKGVSLGLITPTTQWGPSRVASTAC